MSELPSGWMKIPLGEALHIQKGKKPNGLGPKGGDRFIPYINIAAFETKRIEEYAPQQNVPRCEPSDTLLVWDGARAGLAGRGIGGFIGSTLARLTSDVADSSYLYYFVHLNYGYLNTHTKGVGIPHIDPIELARITFLLPPLSEQTRIVAKLEELLSDLDTGVAELKAAKKKLAQYRQSLLKAAVEGTLTAEWRAKNPATETGAQLLARILTERRARWEAMQLAKFKEQGKAPPKDWQKKYPEPVQPDTTGLPELPQGWVWACLDALIVDGPQNGLYLPGDRYGFGTPILRIDDYQIGWHRSRASLNLVNADDALCKTYSLVIGDLVINRVNSMTHLGKSLLVTKSLDGVLFESNMMRSSLSALSSGEFVAFYLGSDVGRMRLSRDAKWAVNQASINQQDVRRTPVPVAPAAEQKVIASLLKEQLGAADRQRVAIEQSLKQSTAQRQNILRAAFSGQLVPQDPNDEPASVLLARIRAERAQREAEKKPRGRKPKEVA